MTDIKLSRRMQAVADMVAAGYVENDGDGMTDDMAVDKPACAAYAANTRYAAGKNVADIGCDHAFVSIYLKLNNIAQNVIAMDVRKGPLDIARANIASYGLADYIDVRLSDGFAALKPGEADTAVIAGMGGILMADILKRGRMHTDNGIKLVLQPQSEPDKLRQYLYDIGYDIEDESFLQEDGKYYTVMRAVKKMYSGTCGQCKKDTPGDGSSNAGDVWTKAQLLYGPVLLKKKDKLLKQYIEKQLKKNNEIKCKLALSPTPRSAERTEELREEERIMLCALKNISRVDTDESKQR
jgi:tRNA (adenine22-N1)-methyltransferase